MSQKQPPEVIMAPDSQIGEFDYGAFRGHAKREEARKERWNTASQSMSLFIPATPARWCVTVYGVENAWRDVILPLKRGRMLKQAIILACGQFKSPNDIKPDKHGYFGGTIEVAE